MTLPFRCPGCQTIFHVEESALGKSVICTNQACGRRILLPKKPNANAENQHRNVSRHRVAIPAGVKSSAVVREEMPQVYRTQSVAGENWLSNNVLMIAGISGAAIVLASILLVIVMMHSTSVDRSISKSTNDSSPSRTSESVASPNAEVVSRATTSEPVNNKEESGNNDTTNELAENDDKSKPDPVVQTEQTDTLLHGPGNTTVEQVVARVEASVAFIEGHRGFGSGFLIRDQLIVTNRHVIESELVDHLKIHFPSAQNDLRGPLPAELIYIDPEKDLAFLKVETAISPLPSPSEYSFRRGQEVIVIGNPGMGDMTLKNAVSRGVMSTEAVIDGLEYYQLGVSINLGNSGGPVLDSSGQVIGVVTLKASQEEGIAFCIPLKDLNVALVKAINISASEIGEVRSRHRLEVVVKAIAMTAENYVIGMKIYLESMEKAFASGKSVTTGLEAVRGTVTEKLNRLDNLLVDSDLVREASRVSADMNLSEPTREKFSELWTNYKELKSNVENPRGTIDTFRSKLLLLCDQHERLMHSLNLQLGIR